MILQSELRRREKLLDSVFTPQGIWTWGWAWPEGYPKSNFKCTVCEQMWYFDDSEPLVMQHIETQEHRENLLMAGLAK